MCISTASRLTSTIFGQVSVLTGHVPGIAIGKILEIIPANIHRGNRESGQKLPPCDAPIWFHEPALSNQISNSCAI